jgi:hypothetical protein
MRVTFSQHNAECGSVVGNGVNWSWAGRHLEGDENAIQVLGAAVQDCLKANWPEVSEAELLEVPAVAMIDWDGHEVRVVALRLNFRLLPGSESCPDETHDEIQAYFDEALDFEPLVRGVNTARIGDKLVPFFIEHE